MKKMSTIFLSLLLAVTIAASLPLQVFAETTTEKYISAVKIGVGKKADDAKKALAGYEILKDDQGNYVDLNKDAGGGTGSKGDRVVYLGYLRTSDKSEAVTDLAVMNMKGGYSIRDYEDLMEDYMKQEIIPFVNGFLDAIIEYRENYNSTNTLNKARADSIHDALNKLLDDDCGRAGLGDLLLNETKYEMGDVAYEALSEEEKNQHADILTIIEQAHGNAVLVMENLITRAADTNEDTWIERFVDTTYEDLLDETGLSPSKAKKELDKLYYDDAMIILGMWDQFKEMLDNFDSSVEVFMEAAEAEVEPSGVDYENTEFIDSTDKQIEDTAREIAENQYNIDTMSNSYTNITVYAMLDAIEYEDGTLLDFFSRSGEDIEDDITVLYPLVAALSPGQKAGLEFITLEDLFVFALTDGSGYEKFDISDGDEAYSIYAGVDREIYETNAVGLTSDALRSGKTGVDDIESPQRSLALSVWSKVLIGLSAASAVGLGASIAYAATISHAKNAIVPKLEAALAKWKDPHFTSDVIYHIDQLDDAIGGFQKDIVDCNRWIRNWQNKTPFGNNTAVNYSMDAEMDWMCMSAEQEAAVRAEFAETQAQEIAKYKDKITELNTRINDYTNEMDSLKQELNEVKGTIKKGEQLADRSSFSKKLMIGSTIMTIIIIGVTIYMIYRDFAAMKAKYKVDFTPAPKFIVEEKDLFTYNSYGDRVIVKNQAIYYKAAPTNRATNAEYYKMLGEVADLNGDVGKQWLALYVEHNEVNDPILADSFKVTSTEQIPSGYDTGIHMFGSTAAENLNNPLYVWNQTAPKVYVYYKLDDGAAASGGASVAGSNFSAGTLAMGALGGAVIGILITMFGMTKLGKKKKEAAA